MPSQLITAAQKIVAMNIRQITAEQLGNHLTLNNLYAFHLYKKDDVCS